MCVATVFGLMKSASAISAWLEPAASRSSTWRSRADKTSSFAFPLVWEGALLSTVDKPPDARHELTGIDGLDHVVIGAEEDSRSAVERLGALAGDDDYGDAVPVLVFEPPAQVVAAEAG